ncbi:DUF6087 family protein [Streptomyces sp. NPDC058548]|uniref:DUF6087 family protein n=1 Tax=unclassified Streptomyces TaxID=2593676 RepID=UPI003663D0C9
MPLNEGPRRGAHFDSGSPRAIKEWPGTERRTVGIVENLAAAQAPLHPPPPDRPATGENRGRQQKPTSAEERDR